jgi:trimethylamine:corrinoid methyltransferase-like protein
VDARTFNKQSRSDWMQKGGKGGILDNAEDILDVIIKNHKVPPLPEDIAKEIDNIIESADEKLN